MTKENKGIEINNGDVVRIDHSEDGGTAMLVFVRSGEVVQSIKLGGLEKSAALAEYTLARHIEMGMSFAKNTDPETNDFLRSVREGEGSKRPTGVVSASRMSVLRDQMISTEIEIGQAASLAGEDGRRIRFSTHISGPYAGTDQKGNEEESTLKGIGLQENATPEEIEDRIWLIRGEAHAWNYGECGVGYENIED